MLRCGNKLYFITSVAIIEKKAQNLVVSVKKKMILFTLQTKLLYFMAVEGCDFICFLQQVTFWNIQQPQSIVVDRECCKTRSKVITLANHNRDGQSDEPIRMTSARKHVSAS